MDAFWGEATHAFLQNAGFSNRLIVNEHRGPPRTFNFRGSNKAAWIARIVDDIKNGLNVAVVSLSTEVIHEVVAAVQLQDADTPILVHTSKTDDAVKLMLVKVNELWVRYRLVAFSPTIEVSYELMSFSKKLRQNDLRTIRSMPSCTN
jgi:hypothetical protein